MGRVDGSADGWRCFIEVIPEGDEGLKVKGWVCLVPWFWHWKLCNALLERFE